MKIKYYYKIEENREFNKPSEFRLKYFSYFIDFGKVKLLKSKEEYTGTKNNYAEYTDCFRTESKEEIKQFMDFCIKDDLECR